MASCYGCRDGCCYCTNGNCRYGCPWCGKRKWCKSKHEGEVCYKQLTHEYYSGEYCKECLAEQQIKKMKVEIIQEVVPYVSNVPFGGINEISEILNIFNKRLFNER